MAAITTQKQCLSCLGASGRENVRFLGWDEGGRVKESLERNTQNTQSRGVVCSTQWSIQLKADEPQMNPIGLKHGEQFSSVNFSQFKGDLLCKICSLHIFIFIFGSKNSRSIMLWQYVFWCLGNESFQIPPGC